MKLTDTTAALLSRARCRWPRPKGSTIPRPLQNLALYTLECARVLALRDETVAAIFFGMSLEHALRVSR